MCQGQSCFKEKAKLAGLRKSQDWGVNLRAPVQICVEAGTTQFISQKAMWCEVENKPGRQLGSHPKATVEHLWWLNLAKWLDSESSCHVGEEFYEKSNWQGKIHFKCVSQSQLSVRGKELSTSVRLSLLPDWEHNVTRHLTPCHHAIPTSMDLPSNCEP